MAPTICTEKDTSASRDRFRKNRVEQQNHHHHSNGVLNGGKITHRRSVTSRNASSKLNSFRIQDNSGSESSSDVTTDSHQSIKSIKNEITSDTIKDNNNLKDNKNSSSRMLMEIDEECYDDDDSDDASFPSERLSCANESFSAFRNVKHHNRIMNNHDNELIATATSTSNIPALPISSYYKINDNNTISSSYSTSSSIYNNTSTKTKLTSLTSLDLDQVIATVTKFPQRKGGSTKKLLEIALKTIKLIKRNQMLQKKLAQLQFETRIFIESVMANPENQALRHKIEKTSPKIET